MAVLTRPPAAVAQHHQPIIQYYDLRSVRVVAPGEMVHDYYGVPVWLMQDYLEGLGALPAGNRTFRIGACTMQVRPAQRKRIGSLEIGGATVEFTGTEGAIQAVLTELEWKTLRCGG